MLGKANAMQNSHAMTTGVRQSADLQAWAAVAGAALSWASGAQSHVAANRRDCVRKAWSEGEELVLMEGYRGGQGLEILAFRHGRTRAAVVRRLERLGALQLSARLGFNN